MSRLADRRADLLGHARTLGAGAIAALDRVATAAAIAAVGGAALCSAADPVPAAPPSATQPDPAAPPSASEPAAERVALMVFLDYEENVVPPTSPTLLRLAGARVLTGVLEARGTSVLTYPEIEPAMKACGVRSASDLTFELLETLGRAGPVHGVMVARLVVYRDRVLLLARGLDRTTGILHWVAVTEQPIDAEFWVDEGGAIERWNVYVARLGADLGPRWSSEASEDLGTMLLVLPFRGIGLAEQASALANHALLRSLLATRRHRIPDPALVRTTLQKFGHDAIALRSAGREELETRFSPAGLLAPEIVTFESAPSTQPDFAQEEDGDTGGSPAATSTSPIYFQVLCVDPGSGSVLAAAAAFLEPDDTVGLFGFTRSIPVADRYEEGAEKIVRSLRAEGSL